MTKEEKKSIYNLIKTSSAYILGYDSPEFKSEFNCKDDIIQKKEKPEEIKQIVKQQIFKDSPKTLDEVKTQVQNCDKCVLCKKRIQSTVGQGVSNPDVLIIGDFPGPEDDRSGNSFVGLDGKLLDKMLNAISLDRSCNCYVTNLCKCKPPLKRDPMADEINCCFNYLNAEINILKPKTILVMGRTSAQFMLETNQSLNEIHGKFFDYNGIPIMATYCPRLLNENSELKGKAWEDLKIFRNKLLDITPDYAESYKNKMIIGN